MNKSVCLVVDQVREKMRIRAGHGFNKYGVTMIRDDLSLADWLQHAQEEAMDLAVYLERIMMLIASQRGSEGKIDGQG